jgi:hypothetical protein
MFKKIISMAYFIYDRFRYGRHIPNAETIKALNEEMPRTRIITLDELWKELNE